jgi:hypothetical protein
LIFANMKQSKMQAAWASPRLFTRPEDERGAWANSAALLSLLATFFGVVALGLMIWATNLP